MVIQHEPETLFKINLTERLHLPQERNVNANDYKQLKLKGCIRRMPKHFQVNNTYFPFSFSLRHIIFSSPACLFFLIDKALVPSCILPTSKQSFFSSLTLYSYTIVRIIGFKIASSSEYKTFYENRELHERNFVSRGKYGERGCWRCKAKKK